MNKSQKGFALIESLLIMVVVGILGGTVYYVWHTKAQSDKSLDKAANTSVNATAKKNQNSAKLSDSRYTDDLNVSDWKLFTDQKDELKYSIKLPSDITALTSVPGEGSWLGLSLESKKTNLPNTVFLGMSQEFTFTGTGVFSTDSTYAHNLFKSSGLEAVAEANRQTTIKANNQNPNIKNKEVSPLNKVTVQKGEAWGYIVGGAYATGYKDDLGDGGTVNEPTRIIYISNGTDVYRITVINNDPVIDVLLSGLSLY